MMCLKTIQRRIILLLCVICRRCSLSLVVTELIIHSGRAQMVAGRENALDDQPETYGIREAGMRRNTSLQ